MHTLTSTMLTLVLGLSAAAAEDTAQHAQPGTPEQQYKALLDEYNDAFDEYTKAFRAATLPADREKIIKDKYPRPGKWASRFLELAERNPGTIVAEEALIWIMTSEARLKHFLPWHEHTARYEMIWIMQMRKGLGGDKQEEDVRGKAIDVLIRSHVTSAKMGYVARVLSPDRNSARMLRAILEKNDRPEVKAEACLALAREIQGRIDLARQLRDNPDLVRAVEPFYGKEYLEEVQKANLTELESENEKLQNELTGRYLLELKPARLVELCQELKYTSDSERLLRFLYENDRRDNVRGVACLILAQVLGGRAFSLAATDAAAAGKIRGESESLLQTAVEKYADVQMPLEGSVGKKAEGILFDMRHLSLGKAAPEIEGVDQDGRQFALSDYKGKVILLDFWSEN